MPTYQYACTSCGERLEAVQKFSDEPLTQCPACQGALRKVFSAVGVVFKGSGFYKTDSRTSSNSASSSTEKAETNHQHAGNGTRFERHLQARREPSPCRLRGPAIGPD